MRHAVITFLIVFALLFVFEKFGTHDIFPAPSRVWGRLVENPERFWMHTRATLKEIVGGCALAALFAFPAGWLMARFHSFSRLLQPFLILVQTIPMFVLAPLMIFWFDWSYTAVVVPTALMIFFPLTIATYRGLSLVPEHLTDYFRIQGATEWQRLMKLQLPWAMPHICSGLRVSSAVAATGAIAGEWAGAQEGLGVLMMESRRGVDLETTFAAFICLALLSVTIYGLMASVEQLILFQRRPARLRGWLHALLLLLLFTGCTQESSPQAKPLKLILDWLPNPNHVPLYVGIKKGYFQEEGLDVGIMKIQDPSDVFSYLATGQADLGISYMPHFIQCCANGSDLRPVAYLIKQPLNSLIFRKDRIHSLADLNGKVFSHTPDDLLTATLHHLLEEKQIRPKGQVAVSFDLVTALMLDKVDVLYGGYWNIEGEQLRALGIETSYLPITDLGLPPYFELMVIATGKQVEKRPELTAKFKNALQKSIEECRLHPEEAFETYLSMNPDKGPLTTAWEKRAFAATLPLFASNQDNEPEIWQRFLDWSKERNLVHRQLNLVIEAI